MNLSDLIEEFILNSFEDDFVQLSRNEMAKYFDVSPSQINYVISTRFTASKGYDIESKRGGDGYIKIYRLDENKNEYIAELLKSDYTKSLDEFTANQLLSNMQSRLFINEDEYNLMKVILSSKSLKSPINIENTIRANIFKQFLISLLKGEK